MNYPYSNSTNAKTSFSFQDVINIKTESKVAKFILKAFFRASFIFLIFGVVTAFSSWGVSVFFVNTIQKNPNFATSSGLIIFFIILIAMMFAYTFTYSKWASNVANASKAVIVTSVLFASFMYLFLLSSLIGVLSVVDIARGGAISLDNLNQQLLINVLRTTSTVFVGGWLAYLIPAAIGYFLKNQKIVKNIAFVITVASVLLFILLTVNFVLWIVSGNLRTNRIVDLIFFALFSIITFLMPIVTIFRFKKVAQQIDYNDQLLLKRWNFFMSFNIFVELLNMVYLVLNILYRLRG
ncbi:hypothetical protein MCAV_03150 [[Mycoplasma] cavipharyngis]|uniref:hypothetical protein n=1 Tax=[Mycoplasma] cavipharyngis TaxID=92757 RepID=UPI003703ACA1